MTHPEELLADYVDGSLSAADRATIDAHLRECSRCRGEVSLASAARAALGSVPIAPVPGGIATAVLDEEQGAPSGTRGGTPVWYRFVAVAAAVAAVVVVIAIALPRIGSGSSGSPERASTHDGVQSAAAGAKLNAATRLEVQQTNYTVKSIQDLAAPTGFATAGGQTAPTSTAPPVPQAPVADASKAVSCLTSAAPDIMSGAQLQRLIEATFEKRPAYIAVLAEGPGAGQPADKLVVLAVSKPDCMILSFTQTRI